VERLTNSLMMHGRNNGKKLMAVRIVKHSFEIIHLLTGEVSPLDKDSKQQLHVHRAWDKPSMNYSAGPSVQFIWYKQILTVREVALQ